jgi:hypothetical protein
MVLAPGRVRACSGSLCTVDQFVPHGGSLPANAKAIAWWPGNRWEDDNDAGDERVYSQSSDLTFRCKAAGAVSHDIGFTTHSEEQGRSSIEPASTLPEGEDCTIVPAYDCEPLIDFLTLPIDDAAYLDNRAAFHVSAPASMPTTLGTLSAKPASDEAIDLSEGASCSALVTVCVVRAKLELGADAKPWGDAFVYTTWVDGKSWMVPRSAPLATPKGGSYAGRGEDLFYAMPGPYPSGLAPGKHSVVFRARLPGTALELATDPITIDLDCASLAAGNPPVDGKPTQGAAGADADAAAAHADADAGLSNAKGGRQTDLSKSKSDGGCSVAQLGSARAGSLSTPSPVVALLLGIAFGRMRARKLRPARSPN